MPLREETLNFEDEIKRIEQQREELAAEVAQMEKGNPAYAQKVERGRDLSAYLDGLEWARDHAHEDNDVPAWDADVDTVTLGGLNSGEYGALEQNLADAEASGDQGAAGAQRVFQVRAGTVAAPYLDAEMGESEELAAVASLPVGFVKWACDRIDDFSTVGNGDRASFDDLVKQK